MVNKISKILDSLLARAAFDMTKGDVRHSYKDYIMLEMLRSEDTMARRILGTKLSEWELNQLPIRIESLMKIQPNIEPLTVEQALLQLREQLLSHNPLSHNISTAHALCEIASDTTTATSQVLAEYGITSHSLQAALRELGSSLQGSFSSLQINTADKIDTTPQREQGASLLERFGCDLTQLARDGKIDPVIGREKEIERMVQILTRRKKNNPILIGEAGVGKSAIVEGLALRIASKDVPITLRRKRLFSLDVTSLVAGTKYRGEFEERIQQIMEELRTNNHTILFIDEIHTIVGAGSTQGALDTANILKPALSRGDIQTIGATTLDEFRQHIESDAALERRFQRIMVEPATATQTLGIVRKIAPHYERHHNVRYTEEALQGCVALTERYLPHRHFPDKAIDVLDEAGAYCHLHHHQQPHNIQQTEKELEQIQEEHHRAIKTLMYEKAATTRLKEVALKSRLGEQVRQWQKGVENNPASVTLRDVERVITTMTGIPIERITANDAERLRSLKEYLEQKIIGQAEAIERITRSLQRSRAGLKEDNHPIGVFLFVGQTGVGKTLLAKELSKQLFDSERSLIRIDMSEYSERHTVARLTGSPPGYVGYGEGGELTEAVRRHPYAVVLFDEIEKAHPDIFNIMLQILDEGVLTDSAGRKVDFRNTIIILTSNVGSRVASDTSMQVGFETRSKQNNGQSTPQEKYYKALESVFTPEFLNRIDEVIPFNPLSLQEIERIAQIHIKALNERMRNLGYRIEVSLDAIRHIASLGYESRYGARALRRTIIKHIEEPLSALIVEGKLTQTECVVVEKNSSGITLKVA